MPVVIPFFAIGVALLLLLIAYALTALLTPILEGMARSVPVVGGYIARGIDKAISYAASHLTKWAESGIGLCVGWVHGLWSSWSDFVDAVNAFIVDLPGKLDHLTHVTVHEIVHAFVNPVRDLAHDAHALAGDALDQVNALGRSVERDLHSFEGQVQGELQRTLDRLRNIDLPNLHGVIDREIDVAVGRVAGDLRDVTGWADHEFGRVWDQLHAIPLARLLDLLAASVGAFALLNVIANEAGLNRAECRDKVRNICSTDPDAWRALLEVAGFALAFVGIEEFLQLAQDFAREGLPLIEEAIGGG